MTDILIVFGKTLVAVGLIIAMTRAMGLRSFSKMSGYDFAITVAMGSVLASAATTPNSSLLVGMAAILALFLIQKGITVLRAKVDGVPDMLDNDPLLIMEDGKPLTENLNSAGMTMADLRGKLREANAYDLSRVQAVIFEPTGDVSVLHGDTPVDPELMKGVVRDRPR